MTRSSSRKAEPAHVRGLLPFIALYIGIMENKTETTIVYWGCIILGLYWGYIEYVWPVSATPSFWTLSTDICLARLDRQDASLQSSGGEMPGP